MDICWNGCSYISFLVTKYNLLKIAITLTKNSFLFSPINEM